MSTAATEGRPTAERLEILTPLSITHKNILSVINTERPGTRILDVGCGAGRLISYFDHELYRLTGVRYEILGVDVDAVDFDNVLPGLQAAVELLNHENPGINWAARIKLMAVAQAWPVPDGSMDCIVSNQVLEHVKDIGFFFAHIAAKLREGGISVNVFPLKNVLWEAHMGQPFAHWITNWDLASSYMRWVSHLGLGYQKQRKMSHAEFAEDAADSLLYHCFYRSYLEMIRAAKMAGLRASLRYTAGFFISKLRSVMRMSPRFVYRRGLFETLAGRILSCASSVTLFLEKRNITRG